MVYYRLRRPHTSQHVNDLDLEAEKNFSFYLKLFTTLSIIAMADTKNELQVAPPKLEKRPSIANIATGIVIASNVAHFIKRTRRRSIISAGRRKKVT